MAARPFQTGFQHSSSGEEAALGLRAQSNGGGQVPFVLGTNSNGGSSWSPLGHRSELTPMGLRKNLYPGSQPDFMLYPVPTTSSRPEPGNPLYTSLADRSELRLINLQFTGPDNYSTWGRDFRRALVTKDKGSFLNITVAFPNDDRMQVQPTRSHVDQEQCSSQGRNRTYPN